MANALQAVLDKANRDPAPAAPPPAPVRKAPRAANAAAPAGPQEEGTSPSPRFHRPSRDNRRFVGGHFAPAVGKQLRMIAVEDETTVQALLEEAQDLLFVKKGRQKIADLSQ